MSLETEVARLRAWLDQPELSPGMVLVQLPGFSLEVRDELVREVASGEGPPPSLRVLARLTFLIDESNVSRVAAAYRAQARAHDPEARKISLRTLDALGDSAVEAMAVQALDDSADGVVAAAFDILARRMAGSPSLRSLMQGVFDAHGGDPRFSETRAVLQAHGIGGAPPAEPGDEVA